MVADAVEREVDTLTQPVDDGGRVARRQATVGVANDERVHSDVIQNL